MTHRSWPNDGASSARNAPAFWVIVHALVKPHSVVTTEASSPTKHPSVRQVSLGYETLTVAHQSAGYRPHQDSPASESV